MVKSIHSKRVRVMVQYIFKIGRKPQLSLTEIKSLFPETADKENLRRLDEDMIIVTLQEELKNPQETLDRMGGTRKIAKIIAEKKGLQDEGKKWNEDELIVLAQQYIHDKHPDPEAPGKILLSGDEQKLKSFLQKLKKNLKSEGYKIRYMETNPLGEGIDFILAGDIFATTVATQNIAAYGERDYGKPYRDTKSGMLPPKLAQIMINLAGVQPHTTEDAIPRTTLYDPFCGSGTILMEAMLMGYDVIGSDLDQETIEGAETNITFVDEAMKNGVRKFQVTHYPLFQKDAQQISEKDLPKKPDLIVFEAYLGPFFKGEPTRAKVQEIQRDLEKLYREAFKKICAFGVPIVTALPCHKVSREYLPLPNITRFIEENGYETESKAGTSGRGGLIYDRPDQKVAREIFVLKPKK